MAGKAHGLQLPAAQMRGIRIASWAVMGVFVLIPVGCALAAIAFAFAGIGDRSAADAYSAAPTCAAVGPASPAPCRRLLPAVIESTRVVRSGKSVTTSVSLLVAGDRAERTTLSGDQSGGLAAGAPVTVTVWGTSIAQIADSAQAWTSQDSPIYHASNDFAGLIATLAASLVCARILGWAAYGRRTVPIRFALADVSLVMAVVAVAILSAVHRATAAASLTAVVAVLLAASVTVWPWLTWVRRPGL